MGKLLLDVDTSRKPLLDAESELESSLANRNGSAFLFQKPAEVVSEVHSEHTSQFCGRRGWTELQTQCRLAFPLIYVNLAQYSLQIISLMFVGHLGELALSSAAIANSFASVTGNTLMLGMGSALDTICGQAYGAKQYHLIWLFLQKAEVVLNATCIPVAFIWLFMEKILLLCHQDSDIASNAGEYARFLIPALFGYASLQPLVKYLQTQNIIVPMAILSTSTLIIHIPLCWLLVYKFSLGYRGAALATGISNWLNVILLSLYIMFSQKCEKSRGSLSWEALRGMKTFFSLAIPSALMICLEYWSFEMLIFLSGLLPDPELETANLSICLSTSALVYMIPFGLGAAASTRVSNALGGGHAKEARDAVRVVFCITVLETLVVSVSLFLARNLVGKAYSSDPEVIQYFSSMMLLVSGTTILDGIQGVASGIARGCGWQKLGAYVNLGSYYIVGLPLAITLGFPLQMGGKGLWMGIFGGVSVQTILLLAITATTDWEKQAKEAVLRVSSSVSEAVVVEQ